MLTILPPSCAAVMKSGYLKFLEPSAPLQACNGTALPLQRNDIATSSRWTVRGSNSRQCEIFFTDQNSPGINPASCTEGTGFLPG